MSAVRRLYAVGRSLLGAMGAPDRTIWISASSEASGGLFQQEVSMNSSQTVLLTGKADLSGFLPCNHAPEGTVWHSLSLRLHITFDPVLRSTPRLDATCSGQYEALGRLTKRRIPVITADISARSCDLVINLSGLQLLSSRLRLNWIALGSSGTRQ